MFDHMCSYKKMLFRSTTRIDFFSVEKALKILNRKGIQSYTVYWAAFHSECQNKKNYVVKVIVMWSQKSSFWKSRLCTKQ